MTTPAPAAGPGGPAAPAVEPAPAAQGAPAAPAVEPATPAELVHRPPRGVLGVFNRAGVLGYADVHVALRLGALSGDRSDQVALAAALAVRAVRRGSVCVPIATVATGTAVDGLSTEEVAALPWPDPAPWAQALRVSPMVALGADGPADRPLRFVDGRLYLDRYWRQERVVAEYVDRAVVEGRLEVDEHALQEALGRLFPGPATDRQRLAAVVAAHRRFSIVAGGPGTGKTTTVARLLAVLQDLAGGQLRVALAAPTGKAAARLTEAVTGALADLDAEDRDRLGALTARTLHRLLGSKRGARTRFWHDRDNRLPYDVVVVDEASMVSLTMMSRLVEALRPECRLVLVGDPDQLSSVEAGAVLGDLAQRDAPRSGVPVEEASCEAESSVDAGLTATADLTAMEGASADADLAGLSTEERQAALRGGVVRLRTVHRFSAEIQQLAEAIRTGSAGALDTVLAAQHPCVELVEADPGAPAFSCDTLRADVLDTGRRLVEAARAGAAEAALEALDGHRVLCGHREGPYGVTRWTRQVEEWLAEELDGYARDGQWYVGRPVLVTANDYQLKLFNGDTGVVIDAGGEPRVAFRRDGRVDLLGPSRLSDVQTVHAMSVHRSQGSQFGSVTVVLPPEGSPLLTRELVYTAVTRAREHVRIVGSRAALVTAIERPIQRASGLRGIAVRVGPEA